MAHQDKVNGGSPQAGSTGGGESAGARVKDEGGRESNRRGGTTTEDLVNRQGEDSSDEPES
jgi:hypothetical protein